MQFTITNHIHQSTQPVIESNTNPIQVLHSKIILIYRIELIKLQESANPLTKLYVIQVTDLLTSESSIINKFNHYTHALTNYNQYN